MDSPGLNSSDEVDRFLTEQGLASPSPTHATDHDENDANDNADVTATANDIESVVNNISINDEDKNTTVHTNDGNDADVSNVSSDAEITFNQESLSLVDDSNSQPPRPPGDSTTNAINRVLASSGIATSPATDISKDPNEILRIINDLGDELRRKDSAIDRLAYESKSNDLNNLSVDSMSMQRDDALESARRALKSEKMRSDRLAKEVDQLKNKAATEIRKLKSSAEGLKREVQQEVHKGRAKDAVIEKLTTKVRRAEDKHDNGRKHREGVRSERAKR